MQKLQTGECVAERDIHRAIVRKTERLSHRSLPQRLRTFVHVPCGLANPSARVGVAIVEDNECTVVPATVGERVDVLVHVTGVRIEVIEKEILHFGKQGTSMQERRNLALMARNQPGIDALVLVRAAEFHSVFLPEAFDLAMSEHRQSGKRGHYSADAEVLVALTELPMFG